MKDQIARLLALTIILALLVTEHAACGTPILDPSAEPFFSFDSSYAERFRVLGDINFDGLQDMALSDDMSTFGTGGIQLTIFLQTDAGSFKDVGSMFTFPWRISVERLNDEFRIWGTSHSNAGTSGLYYCELVNDSLVNCKGVTIHPGDGGTNIGRAIHTAVFNNSDVKMVVQRSRTSVDGEVVWEDR